MTDKEKRIIRFADMHSIARVNANKSQEYMAEALDVSKRTIQNWEKGISSPTFFQSLEWFRALSINPFPHYFKFVNPDNNCNSKFKNDEEIDKAFDDLCKNMTTSSKRAILYVFLGNHGSSPTAILQLALAYLHLSLKTRSSHTSTVIHDFLTEKNLGILNDKTELPNMDILIKAFECANASILKRIESYNEIE